MCCFISLKLIAHSHRGKKNNYKRNKNTKKNVNSRHIRNNDMEYSSITTK